MLNAKSVAIKIVQGLNPQWVEEFFSNRDELIEGLVVILNQFRTLDELVKADEIFFFIRQRDGGFRSFRREILLAYEVGFAA